MLWHHTINLSKKFMWQALGSSSGDAGLTDGDSGIVEYLSPKKVFIAHVQRKQLSVKLHFYSSCTGLENIFFQYQAINY